MPLLCFAGWLRDWRRGEETVRDEHGRLKPAWAVLAILGPWLALALVLSAVDGS